MSRGKDDVREPSSRERASRSRSRSRDRRRSSSRRSSSRDRDRKRSRSPSSERHRRRDDERRDYHRRRHRSRSRSRSRDRDRGWRDERTGPSRSSRRRESRAADADADGYGGYVPRPRNPNGRVGIMRPGLVPQPAAAYHDPDAARAAENAAKRAASSDPLPKIDVAERARIARAYVLQQQASALGSLTSATGGEGRLREVYVGNLTPGLVTNSEIEQLLNATMAAGFPELAWEGKRAVVHSKLSIDGKFAFVMFQTTAMADAALQLQGIELCGKPLTFARPEGWIPPDDVKAIAKKAEGLMKTLIQSSVDAISSVKAKTRVVRLQNLIQPESLDDMEEYAEVVEDIEEECRKCGAIEECVVPRRSDSIEARMKYVGDAMVMFADVDAAAKAIKSMNGREFDGNKVKATYMDETVFRELLRTT